MKWIKYIFLVLFVGCGIFYDDDDDLEIDNNVIFGAWERSTTTIFGPDYDYEVYKFFTNSTYRWYTCYTDTSDECFSYKPTNPDSFVIKNDSLFLAYGKKYEIIELSSKQMILGSVAFNENGFIRHVFYPSSRALYDK